MREPGIRWTDPSRGSPQRRDELHLAHADGQSQHARQLRLERRFLAPELGARAPLGDGGKKAALFIMYDEGYANPPLIYAGFSGTSAKPAYKSTASYNHYSLIKLIEDECGGVNLGQGDVNATSALEFFTGSGGPPPPAPPPPAPPQPR